MELWKTHHKAPEVHGILFGNTATYQKFNNKIYYTPRKRDSLLLLFPSQ